MFTNGSKPTNQNSMNVPKVIGCQYNLQFNKPMILPCFNGRGNALAQKQALYLFIKVKRYFKKKLLHMYVF